MTIISRTFLLLVVSALGTTAFGADRGARPAKPAKSQPAAEDSPMMLRVNVAKGELDLRFKNQRLLTYAFAADQFKPYVKSLYTLQGADVLQDSPPDHLHHHGLMYAIRVNGVNFWEERDAPGHERSVKILSHETGRSAAGLPQAMFTQLIHWVTHTNAALADTAPVALLIERRTITVTVDEAKQEVALDWRGEFEVGATKVALTGSDYNGLGLRLPPSFDHVARHENSENTPYAGKGQRGVTPAKWSKVSHTVDGRKLVVTLFDRPGNAGGQARFFTMLEPFAYLAVTQGLDKAPLEYAPGAKFSVNYRLTVRTENPSAALDEATYYRMETLPIPSHIKLEVGGLAFMPDQRLMIGTRRGEVWSLRDGQWKRFATGLDEAMGVCPISNKEIVVAQRPELTRITDTDGDGVADLYETLADDWKYSGHIYEWTFGPVRDKEGNFYGTLACWFYSTKEYDKPPYSGWKMPVPVGYKPSPESAWHGWSFKVTPEGKFVPWSVGLRSPNGLGISPDGALFVSDNQGEYFGSSVLHHVTPGAFHGHPNGFFWGPEAVSDPFAIPLDELEKRRKLAAIQLPYGVMGQSASEPVWDTTGGKFGPFAGQMFIGDQTKSTVMRVQLEKVDGEFQGACFPFRSGFQCGNNRHLFEPSGSLLVGQTDRGWGAVGGQPYGLQRLVWTGALPMEIQTMQLTREGFDLTFTKPVDPATAGKPEAYSLERYHYHYHRTYGSPQVDRTPVPLAGVRVSADRRRVSLLVKDLVPRKIYELHLSGLKAADGADVLHPAAYYTLNRLQTAAVAKRAGF